MIATKNYSNFDYILYVQYVCIYKLADIRSE